jgi:flagellar biosynthesis protein FlhF
VWRLDGRGPNTAEALSIYSEVLGVPVARAWNGESQPVNLEFFDLPGTDWWDSSAMSELADRIEQIKPTEVHLVLNAAYDASGLLGQLERFSKLPLTDIIFSHLDEPVQAGRLWNIVLASELPIRFLSAGQNVPGHFRQASHDQLLPEEFQQ